MNTLLVKEDSGQCSPAALIWSKTLYFANKTCVSVIALQAAFISMCGDELLKDLPFYLNTLNFLCSFCDKKDLKSNSVTARVKYFTMENLTCQR